MNRLKKALSGFMPLVLIFSLTLVGCGQQATTTSGPSTPANEISAQDLLTAVKTIDLPGKGGHGDVVAYDSDKKALYVSHTPDNNLIIINTETQAIEKIIPNMNGVCGIAVGPKYIYIANGVDSKLGVIEKGTWNVVANVDTGGKTPDAVYYDDINKKVFVGNIDTNNMSVISPDVPFKLVTSFDLSTDKPKAGQDLGVLIPSKNRIYQSVDNYIVVIDTASNKILNKITEDVPIGATGGLKDMIYDPNKNIIWMGTTSKKVFALNPDTGKTTEVAAQNGMDQIAWDPAINMLFLGEKSADSGALEVINMATQKSIGAVKTEAGFHTLNVDTDKHMVYAYYNTSNKVVIYKENMDLIKK
jgi:DNA-binding beta-propeller fold protein YncE